VRQKSVE
jgi:tetratricopeptide (TPR) repeat protein